MSTDLDPWVDLRHEADADLYKGPGRQPRGPADFAMWTAHDEELLVQLLASTPARSELLLDFSYARPSVAALLPYAGVIGYLSPNPAKNLPAALIRPLLAAGRAVGLVWQAGGTGPLGGPAQGRLDAKEADRQATALAREVGVPNDELPLRFANDFAPRPDQRRTIEGYYQAADGTTARPGADAYGPDYLLDWLGLAGLAPTWQTRAWSSGRISRHAGALQQAGAPFYGAPEGRAVDENVRIGGRPFPLWTATTPTVRPRVVGVAWRRPVAA